MSSEATTAIDLAVPPATALAATTRALQENKHRVVEQSADGSRLTFLTRKTMFTWELDGTVTITPTATGSHIELRLDTAAGRPAALLDAKKNLTAAEKLAGQIRAAAQ